VFAEIDGETRFGQKGHALVLSGFALAIVPQVQPVKVGVTGFDKT
jgi:hypothetical protein